MGKGVKVDPKALGVKCSTTHLSHNSTMEIMPEVSLVMGAPGAHPKDNVVNKGVQVITTDQKKPFFRSDHEAMKMLREKKMSGWNSKTKIVLSAFMSACL